MISLHQIGQEAYETTAAILQKMPKGGQTDADLEWLVEYLTPGKMDEATQKAIDLITKNITLAQSGESRVLVPKEVREITSGEKKVLDAVAQKLNNIRKLAEKLPSQSQVGRASFETTNVILQKMHLLEGKTDAEIGAGLDKLVQDLTPGKMDEVTQMAIDLITQNIHLAETNGARPLVPLEVDTVVPHLKERVAVHAQLQKIKTLAHGFPSTH